MDGFPSGQRGQTVNLLSTTSKVRILLHPLHESAVSIKDAGVAELADAQLDYIDQLIAPVELTTLEQSADQYNLIPLVHPL